MLTVYCVQMWILQKVIFVSWAQHVMIDAREVKKKKKNEESRFNFYRVSTRF